MPDTDTQTDRQPLLDLSLPQLVAGATAAATSAILIGRLDLLGTVIGAAFASVVSAIARDTSGRYAIPSHARKATAATASEYVSMVVSVLGSP